MPVRARPLSPHLQIYSWQIGNTLSILHRLTGGALALGLIALCYWLSALAGGEATYADAVHLFASSPGTFFLIGWTFAFTYHFLNGVRHLFWDAGYGFERGPRHMSGWAAVLGAVFATAGIWAFILGRVHA